MTWSRSASLRPLIALATAAAALVGLTMPPATAYGFASSVTGMNGVIYDTCHHHPFEYAIDPDKAAYDWSMRVSIYDPRGVEVSSAWLWKDEGDPSSGTASGDDGLQICSDETPGTWRIEAELNFYGGPYADERIAPRTFTMSAARSRTSLSVNDRTARVGQKLKFKTRVTGQFPNGYFPLRYEDVRLQVNKGGRWKTMASGMTSSSGVARFTVVWKEARARNVRVVAAPGSPYLSSKSRTLRIR